MCATDVKPCNKPAPLVDSMNAVARTREREAQPSEQHRNQVWDIAIE